MNIDTWLKASTAALERAGISTARLDCLVLLSDELGKDKAWILSHPEHVLQGSEIEKLNTFIAQRAHHTPLAYLRGKAEFYGREFTVNEHTLVPRPETETIIELLKQVVTRNQQTAIYDIGTGSGAIAITAKLEFPNTTVTATDIDEKCLKTARQNAEKLGAEITLLHGSLLAPITTLRTKVSILLCNLPYVPDDFQINTAAKHEPRHALFGGPDGLDLYRELFEQTKELTTRPAYILTEALPPQHDTLAAIAKTASYSLEQTDDFIQLFMLKNT